MENYSCPMHPEIEQKKPGRCPKCGMRLVVNNNNNSDHRLEKSNYTPLFIIISLILLASFMVSVTNTFSWVKFMQNFMIGFFLVFSGFKLIDLNGFAQGYSTYDLLAKKVYRYGFIYPFIELTFTLLMIINFQIKLVLLAEVIVMVFSGIGVMVKIAKKEKFICACLGTFLKVPLTKITLIEDFGMALLGLILIIAKP